VEIPSWVRRRTNKWNRVVDFAANPCDAPLAVYFQSFRPAAGKALITLLTFGLDDVARGYFRPKGVYPRGCLGRRKRGRTSVYLPELGEEIGKRLPAADAVKSRSFGTIEKNLWLLDGVSQRVLFWIMVADIVTDFTYDWASGIYKAGYCETADQAQQQSQNTTYHSQDTEPTTWVLGQPGNIVYERHAAFFRGPPAQLIGDTRAHATCAWRIDNNGFADGAVTLGFQDEDPAHDQQQTVGIGVGGSATVTFNSIRPGRQFLATLGAATHTGPFLATLLTFNLIGADPPTPAGG
jgi:hypothetical protein